MNLSKGEAEANSLLRETLTPEILQRQTIEKWDGKLPLIVGKDVPKLLNLRDLVDANQN